MKVLAIDIETSPSLAYVWGLWDQNVGLNQIVDTTEVLCFAAKFVGEKKVHFASVHHDGKQAMLQKAHDLLSEADVVMHWNGKRFDIPHLFREFVLAGMAPPAPFAQLDLLHVARRQFKFLSNKLEHVSKQLGLPGKVKHDGFELWTACMAGDEKAWRLMRRYNIQDVRLLEGIYERFQPWIPSFPNRRLYDGTSGCPSCGVEGQMQRRGYAYTKVSRFQRWQCQACGSWTRSSRRVEGVEMTSIAAA
jgi:DNA polymerase elongation subunit (family B)